MEGRSGWKETNLAEINSHSFWEWSLEWRVPSWRDPWSAWTQAKAVKGCANGSSVWETVGQGECQYPVLFTGRDVGIVDQKTATCWPSVGPCFTHCGETQRQQIPVCRFSGALFKTVRYYFIRIQVCIFFSLFIWEICQRGVKTN